MFSNVIGVDTQNFNPTHGALDFVTVQSSETLDSGILNFGLFVNYAKNTFPYFYFEENNENEKLSRNNSLTSLDLNFGIGLSKNWDLGFSFPYILSQEADTNENVGNFSATGNSEARVSTKYRLFQRNPIGFALVGTYNQNLIKNNPFLGKMSSQIFNLEIVFDAQIKQMIVGLNFGYRWRNPGEAIENSGLEPMPNQVISSLGISYYLPSLNTNFIAEVINAEPHNSNFKTVTDQAYSVSEYLIGIKYSVNTNFAFHIGYGSKISTGLASPDSRVYCGVNFSFGPILKDKDSNLLESNIEKKKKSQLAPFHKRSEDRFLELARRVEIIEKGDHKQINLNRLNYSHGDSKLNRSSFHYLYYAVTQALEWLNEKEKISKIVVEVHTSAIGDEEENLILSHKRSKLITNIFKKKLSFKTEVIGVGKGGYYPLSNNANYQGRMKNERTEIKIFTD